MEIYESGLDSATTFYNGVARVAKNGRIFFINSLGMESYDYITDTMNHNIFSNRETILEYKKIVLDEKR
nr:hypothetical protein [Haliscomenobacter hydrossis]